MRVVILDIQRLPSRHGRALAAALVGVELVQVVEGPDHVAGVVHDHDAAAADHRTDGGEAGGVHDDIEYGDVPCRSSGRRRP